MDAIDRRSALRVFCVWPRRKLRRDLAPGHRRSHATRPGKRSWREADELREKAQPVPAARPAGPSPVLPSRPVAAATAGAAVGLRATQRASRLGLAVVNAIADPWPRLRLSGGPVDALPQPAISLDPIEENSMTTYDSSPRVAADSLSAPPVWVCVLLGLVMIAAGFLVSGRHHARHRDQHACLSAGCLSSPAPSKSIHAFWTKGWGGFVWQVLLGILYIAFGVVLVGQPVASALILTYVLGLLLLISGVVRVLLGISHWKEAGWIMLLSGVFGVLAGLVILTGFPMTGLWVLGFVLGVDLISHGIAWLTYAWQPTTRSA